MKLLSRNAILLLWLADLSPTAYAFLPASVSTTAISSKASAAASVTSPTPHSSLVILQESSSKETSETTSAGVLEDLFVREADAIFDTFDANKDGEISSDELRNHLEEKGYPSDSIRMLFTTLDKNADGIISREEMRYAFSKYEISALYRAFGLGNQLASENSGSSSSSSEEAAGDDSAQDDSKEGYDDAVLKIRSKAMSSSEAQSYSPAMLTKLADIIFDMIDADGSGEIDVLELRKHFGGSDESSTTTCFRQVGDRVSAVASVESILKALDINEDGVISREEMRSGFQQYDPAALSSALGLQVSRTAET